MNMRTKVKEVWGNSPDDIAAKINKTISSYESHGWFLRGTPVVLNTSFNSYNLLLTFERPEEKNALTDKGQEQNS